MKFLFYLKLLAAFLITFALSDTTGLGQAPPIPATEIELEYGCGATTVLRNIVPAGANYDWYWQNTATGTSTTLGTAGSIVRTGNNNHLYLRARLKASPFTWSTGSQDLGPIPVYIRPVDPPAVGNSSTAFPGGSVTLSVEAVSGATAYVWYNVSSGGTALGYGLSYTRTNVTSAATYYVSSFAGGCESTTRKAVSAVIESLPQIQAIGNPRVSMGTPVVLGVVGTYATYSWKNSSNVQVGTGVTYTTAQAGTYTVTVTKAGISGSGVSPVYTLLNGFQGQNLNYIVNNQIQIDNITDLQTIDDLTAVQNSQTAQYFDGFGRPLQTVNTQASPGGKDIVQPVMYDAFGRENKKYLPIPAQTDGWYKEITYDASGNYTGIAANVYNNNPSGKIAQDVRPFSETIFEASPLNRPLKNYGNGNDWGPSGSNKYIEHQYLINAYGTTTGQEKIIAWKIDGAGMPVREVALTDYFEAGGYYSTGQVRVQVTIDEQQNTIREYTNKLGQVILKKVQAISPSTDLNNTAQWAMTYYLYDDFGNLRYVFPPELSRLIHNGGDTYVVTATNLTNWAFQYKYDARKRMIEKRVPGSDWVYMAYDDRDRLVLTQDGNQRTIGTLKCWTFTRYDALNRPVVMGIHTADSVLSQEKMQRRVNYYYANIVANGGAWYDSYVGNIANNMHGYDNLSYPRETDLYNYLIVTYYDNYDFRSLWPGAHAYFNDALSQTVKDVTYSQPTAESAFVTGQVTGTKVKVLDGGVTGGPTWLKSVNYYDDKYRLIQSTGDNYRGGIDRTTNLYDFTGKILTAKTTHPENDVLWVEKVNASTIGKMLFKSTAGGAWNSSGAVSQQKLAAGQDGWMEVTASETSLYRMVGLSDQNTDNNYTTIDYAFYLSINGALLIYESGSVRITVPGTYVTGDRLKIERTGSTIKYYKNNTLVYTSTVPSSTLLMVDASLHTANSSIVNARSSFSMTTQTITRRFEYDHAGRLINTWHQLNEDPEILLSHNQYNELGQLVDKKLHSTVAAATDARQSVDYRYNIRGWLTSMNNASLSDDGTTNDDEGDYFGMNLGYNTDIGTGNPSLYNGNISAMKWSNYMGKATVKEKSYTYGYDALNRLTAAGFKEKTTGWNAAANNGFSESGYTYDLNGNIMSLTRHDKRGSTAIMDNLTYTYDDTDTPLSNRLLKVNDTGDDFIGFTDGTNTGNDYTYDANGNMTTDQNKGITTAIIYNFLNLPEVVSRGNNTVRYIYDATGRKLTQVVTFNGARKQTDYSGEFIYENDELQFISHEEGRIVVASTKLIYTNPGESIADITSSNATLTTVTQNGTEKYVKAVSNGTVARTGMFPVGGTYPVVAGERYRIRAKGYRDKGTAASSSAAYLLIKANGTDLGWPGAALPVSLTTAQTESWIEQVVTIPAGATTLQAGVVWNTVLAGEIIYLNEFEITKLESTAPEYQYNLKDHLGNVRLTFTTKNETETGLATLETANATSEQGKFLYYNEAIKVDFAPFDHTNAGPTYYSTRLTGGSTNAKYGLTKTLSVMPGDVVNMEVYAKYLDPSSPNWTPALNNFITAINGGTAPAGTIVDGGAAGSIGGDAYPISTIDHTSEAGTPPKAYLNYIVFDRSMTTVLDVGYSRITTASREYGQDGSHDHLVLSDTIKEPGYIYIYLSNENPTAVEVYFDDFRVEHVKSPVVQVDDYYPFGLNYNSYQREHAIPNQYLYNSKELQDELNLGWIDYGARMYDPSIGRWGSIDPLSEKYRRWSPYNYGLDNPVRFTDPDGMSVNDPNNSHCEGCQTSRYTSVFTRTETIKVKNEEIAVTVIEKQEQNVNSIVMNEDGEVTASMITNTTTKVSIDGGGNVLGVTHAESSYNLVDGKRENEVNGTAVNGVISGDKIALENGGETAMGETFSARVNEAINYERGEHDSYAQSKGASDVSNAETVANFSPVMGVVMDVLDAFKFSFGNEVAKQGVLLNTSHTVTKFGTVVYNKDKVIVP